MLRFILVSESLSGPGNLGGVWLLVMVMVEMVMVMAGMVMAVVTWWRR